MSQFDVYGLGHALMDLEFQVSDGFLQDMELVKGSMTLVTDERQAALLARVDHGASKRSCGGSAANTVMAVAQFGGSCCQALRVADDEIGHQYLADMRAQGVETAARPQPGGITGRCLVFITPDGERTMCTFLGESQHFATSDVQAERLRNASWLYIEGYLVTAANTLDAALEAASIARQQGIPRALTFSDVNMILYFREGMEAILRQGVDLIFCNEAEALAFTRADTLDDAREILRQQAGLVCITRGGQGASVLAGAREIEVVAPVVQAVNTNGAGDLFAGAFLYGITHQFSLGEAGRLACLASSTLVTQAGARLQAGQARALLTVVNPS